MIKRRKCKLTREAGKGLGNPLLSELKDNIISPPNSHTLFPQVSSRDNRLPWGNKAIVCHGRERSGKARDGKCFEEVIGTMNCWDANKFNYLSYLLISMLFDESQILKHKKCTGLFHISLAEHINAIK